MQLGDLLRNQTFHFLRRLARPDHRRDLKLGWARTTVDKDAHLARDLLFLDQALVQARALSAAENRGRDRKRARIRSGGSWNPVRDIDARQTRQLVVDFRAPLL